MGEKRSHLFFQILTDRHQFVRIAVKTVILRIVQRGFYKCDLIEDLLPELSDPGGDCALKLRGRSLSGKFISGGDQVHDRFRPGQVDPSPEKCSLCKLTGFSQPCAGSQHKFQNTVHQEHAAMRVDLYCILSRITVR